MVVSEHHLVSAESLADPHVGPRDFADMQRWAHRDTALLLATDDSHLRNIQSKCSGGVTCLEL